MDKRCTKCHELKDLDAFSNDRKGRHGRAPRCRACKADDVRAFYVAHPDLRTQRMRLWRASHSAQINEWRRTRYAAHEPLRDRIKARARRWYVADPSRATTTMQRNKRWRESHPEAARLSDVRQARRRDARIRCTSRIEEIDYERIKVRDRMRCHICLDTVRPADLHFDHVFPLARGGTHTEDNIAVAHARCNLSKGAKVLTLF